MLEKVTSDNAEVKALEETNPELHTLLMEHCEKFVNQTYILHPPTGTMAMESQKKHEPFVRTEEKINRNDLCPHCLTEGITIKFKKCAKHCK